MKYTVNPVVVGAIQDLTSHIRNELDGVELRRNALLEQLAAVEMVEQSMWERLPERARIPVMPSSMEVISEPREPSSHVNGHINRAMTTYDHGRTWVEETLGLNGVQSQVGEEEAEEVPQMRMAREVDYTGVDKYPEYVERISQATVDGIVNTTQVAKMLIRDGRSTSTKSNLRGTNQNHYKHNDDYEWVGPGTYQYLPMAGARGDRDK